MTAPRSDNMVGLATQRERTKIRLGDFEIGGDEFVVIAGPCAVETREQLMCAAVAVKAAGARILRGGLLSPGRRHMIFKVFGKRA